MQSQVCPEHVFGDICERVDKGMHGSVKVHRASVRGKGSEDSCYQEHERKTKRKLMQSLVTAA